ncbi:MAG TPA: MFS transporter, partial [Novosphingobium sp.]|nr:MFS transporter [Novosphingobium sp.]
AVLWLGMAINTALPLYGLSILNVHMGDELGLSRATLGTAYATYMLMAGLPGPLVARMIDRRGVRFTLVFGNLMLLLGAAAMATVVTGPLALFACAGLVIGGSNAFAGPITLQASVTRWFSRRRALAMGIMMTGGSLAGIAFAPMLEWLVAATGSWREGWWLICGAAAGLTLLCLWQVREYPEDLGQHADGLPPCDPAAAPEGHPPARRSRVHLTQEEWTLRDVLTSATFWLLLLCSAGVSAVYTIFLAQGVLQIRDLGYSTALAAELISLSVATGFAAHVAISLLGDRVDPKLLWAAGLLFQGAGIGLFAHASQFWLMCVAVGAIGIGCSGAILSIIMVFSNWFGPRASHFVFGFGSAVSATFGALGPVAAGYCYDQTGSFALVFHAVCAICGLAAITLLALKPPHRKLAATPGAHFAR